MVPNEHSPGKKRGRPRKAVEKSPRTIDSDENDNDNDNEEEEAELVKEEEDEDEFGDRSGEDGESEYAGPSEKNAGGSPPKRRRYHQNATPSVITVDSDQEMTQSVSSALSVTSRPLTRSWRRQVKTQKQKQKKGQAVSRRGPPLSGAPTLLDDEVIEISTD